MVSFNYKKMSEDKIKLNLARNIFNAVTKDENSVFTELIE